MLAVSILFHSKAFLIYKKHLTWTEFILYLSKIKAIKKSSWTVN